MQSRTHGRTGQKQYASSHTTLGGGIIKTRGWKAFLHARKIYILHNGTTKPSNEEMQHIQSHIFTAFVGNRNETTQCNSNRHSRYTQHDSWRLRRHWCVHLLFQMCQSDTPTCGHLPIDTHNKHTKLFITYDSLRKQPMTRTSSTADYYQYFQPYRHLFSHNVLHKRHSTKSYYLLSVFCPRNDLLSVERDVKLYSLTHPLLSV